MTDDRDAPEGRPAPTDVRKEPKGFDPDVLTRSVIAVPLLREIEADPKAERPVIVDLNLDYPEGCQHARDQVITLLHAVLRTPKERRDREWPKRLDRTKSQFVDHYLFGELTGEQILDLVRRDRKEAHPAIHRVWPDFPLEAHITHSVRTVKCDAARISFSAHGEKITWAVMDSGIAGDHPHFAQHGNLEPDSDPGTTTPIRHADFTGGDSPLTDEYGHGTHVAGIIAGEIPAAAERVDATTGKTFRVATRLRRDGEVKYEPRDVPAICGMAPKAKLVSLKVLDADGKGRVSNLIAAIAYLQEINGYGRRLQVHGVNMSVGYTFDPEWFACGQSPLCVEVDRLVRSGVVVVVAAGNTGYGFVQVKGQRSLATAGLDLTINDPGNAEQAITVGATHRDSPHLYGVSYFSSKGPTGDGRVKPDLIAPGEKIVSCAAGKPRQEAKKDTGKDCDFREESGTSMAAPHVSGSIAAFLSVQREFIGRPGEVKRIFMDSATDLGRDRYFQGRGLVDVMRAIQSI